MEKPKQYADMKQLEERGVMVKSKGGKSSEVLGLEGLLSIDELVTKMGGKFAKRTLYNWVSAKDLPHRKIRGRLFFNPAEVAQWLERTSG